MADDTAEKPEGLSLPLPPYAGMVENIGEPYRFMNVEGFSGVALESVQEGEPVKIYTALALTSDEPIFHKIGDNLQRTINHMANQAGTAVNLQKASVTLLVMHPDNTAELWLDTAAVSMLIMVKRDLKAGTVVFEHDIADIIGMSFPRVDIGSKDKVLCIFREGWRFGMAFDFNHGENLDVKAFERILGTLVRDLRYRHLYDALGNAVLFARLISIGWFPFVEIIQEVKDLLEHLEADFDIAELEQKILNSFDEPRMQTLLNRWAAKPHLATRMALLQAAVGAFNRKEPVAVIKILLTEIEGALNDAHRAANGGKGAKLKGLLKFAMDSAEGKTGGTQTLMFSKAFADYLAQQTFANFDPESNTGTASSRHAVGHGAAPQDTYTMTRALQVILTLDQLAFYT
ncbi:hypothetical protein K5R88_21915 [Pseudomonas sp. MM213]|uniref:hypothetical protein n=1 Tax=Pseudomonas sp. MM213 TaxID=2866807 RepID=UPI001CF1361C|nr:hypothetical protein [Pseudomonas sp. MM213]UCP08454.1 hypothetical protein K5R88_21915 [Pseudomonas sp. MM213]